MRYIFLTVFVLACTFAMPQSFNNIEAEDLRFEQGDFTVDLPAFFIMEVSHTITIKDNNPEPLHERSVPFIINGDQYELQFNQGLAEIEVVFDRTEPLSVKANGFVFVKTIIPLPLWLSILPPLIAILLALVFREVISSLFFGIVLGACIMGYYSSGFTGIVTGFFSVIDQYLIEVFLDTGHVSVILFSTIIGGIVAVISKNGGMQGIVNRIARYANSAKNGQLATYFLGIAIFFDDYANTLIVGNTMRPLTDRLKVSREKLSYIVDSTAAPVAAVAFVTTWIGAELGYIQDGVNIINQAGIVIHEGPYIIFLNSLRFAFYPVFTLFFILFLVLMNRDFGPMLKAEKRARLSGEVINNLPVGNADSEAELKMLEPVEGKKHRGFNAVIPILVVILGTVLGLFITGWDSEVWNSTEHSFGIKLSTIIGQSDSYKALLWSSMLALIIAVSLTIFQKILSLEAVISTAISGFKSMLSAVLILILAWSLAAVTQDMHTADFLTSLLDDSLAPWLFPAITFLLAAIVAFSTGSSWGTMAILYPLMLPLAWKLSLASGQNPEEAMRIFYGVVSAVLAGSVLGDHCSPISDTTILSSLSTNCNHIDHVRTQLPYALTVGFVSITAGSLLAAVGFPFYVTYPVGLLLLFLIVRYVGRKVPSEPSSL